MSRSERAANNSPDIRSVLLGLEGTVLGGNRLGAAVTEAIAIPMLVLVMASWALSVS